MHALAPNACTMLHARGAVLQRPVHARRTLTRTSVATVRATVLQSLDQHAAGEPEVEGLGIIPQSWGTSAGKLFSQGEHVCDLDALKHLGISCEAGPIVLGRDHFYDAVLSTVFSKLQRHHVGSWLLEAARKPEAAATFESHPELKSWVVQLAEQRFGKDGFLLVQQDSPPAHEAASHVQTLSPCFGKELHSIPVAFKHDTSAAARELLLRWLLELPDAQLGANSSMSVGLQSTAPGPDMPNAGAAATAVGSGLSSNGVLTASQDHDVRLVLEAVSGLLPHTPSLIIKQLPAADSAAFKRRVEVGLSFPAAAALAAAASRSAGSVAAAASAAAAGWVDGKACICVASGVLEKDASSAAMIVVAAAMQGLQLSSRQCTAAFAAAVAAASAGTAVAVGAALDKEQAPAADSDEEEQMLVDDAYLAAATANGLAATAADDATVAVGPRSEVGRSVADARVLVAMAG